MAPKLVSDRFPVSACALFQYLAKAVVGGRREPGSAFRIKSDKASAPLARLPPGTTASNAPGKWLAFDSWVSSQVCLPRLAGRTVSCSSQARLSRADRRLHARFPFSLDRCQTRGTLTDVQELLARYHEEYGRFPPADFIEYEHERGSWQPDWLRYDYLWSPEGIADAETILFRYGLVSYLYDRDRAVIEHRGSTQWIPDSSRDRQVKEGWEDLLNEFIWEYRLDFQADGTYHADFWLTLEWAYPFMCLPDTNYDLCCDVGFIPYPGSDPAVDGIVSWRVVQQFRLENGDGFHPGPYDPRTFPVVRCYWSGSGNSNVVGSMTILNLGADRQHVYASHLIWELESDIPPNGISRLRDPFMTDDPWEPEPLPPLEGAVGDLLLFAVWPAILILTGASPC